MSPSPRTPTIQILIAAAGGLFRDGLRQLLTRREHLRVVATAGGVPEIRGLLTSLSPDVVVVDLGTPDGADLVHAVAVARPQTRIVALTQADDGDALAACAEARVAGYVTADESTELLIDTIQGVARGELRCSPGVADTLLDRVAGAGCDDGCGAERREPALNARLTRREREVLGLIAEGLSNKQIARRLWIELPTVKNHVHSILRKLEVPRRADAVATIGLVPHPEELDRADHPGPRRSVHPS